VSADATDVVETDALAFTRDEMPAAAQVEMDAALLRGWRVARAYRVPWPGMERGVVRVQLARSGLELDAIHWDLVSAGWKPNHGVMYYVRGEIRVEWESD
jgi:hypothetical protein